MTGTQALNALLDRWEARSRDALPADAMLVNRHVRELREVLAADPLPDLRAAVAFIDKVRAAGKCGEETMANGVFRDSREWLERAARDAIAQPTPQALGAPAEEHKQVALGAGQSFCPLCQGRSADRCAQHCEQCDSLGYESSIETSEAEAREVRP